MLENDLTLIQVARARAARRRREGMTLIEIMIVVVIMAMVAAGVGVAVLPSLEKAKVRNTETAVNTVRSAVTMYLATNSGADCPDMTKLVEDKAIDSKTSTKDAWEQEFKIECDGTEIDVTSAGPDKQFGTEDDIPKPEQGK